MMGCNKKEQTRKMMIAAAALVVGMAHGVLNPVQALELATNWKPGQGGLVSRIVHIQKAPVCFSFAASSMLRAALRKLGPEGDDMQEFIGFERLQKMLLRTEEDKKMKNKWSSGNADSLEAKKCQDPELHRVRKQLALLRFPMDIKQHNFGVGNLKYPTETNHDPSQSFAVVLNLWKQGYTAKLSFSLTKNELSRYFALVMKQTEGNSKENPVKCGLFSPESVKSDRKPDGGAHTVVLDRIEVEGNKSYYVVKDSNGYWGKFDTHTLPLSRVVAVKFLEEKTTRNDELQQLQQKYQLGFERYQQIQAAKAAADLEIQRVKQQMTDNHNAWVRRNDTQTQMLQESQKKVQELEEKYNKGEQELTRARKNAQQLKDSMQHYKKLAEMALQNDREGKLKRKAFLDKFKAVQALKPQKKLESFRKSWYEDSGEGGVKTTLKLEELAGAIMEVGDLGNKLMAFKEAIDQQDSNRSSEASLLPGEYSKVVEYWNKNYQGVLESVAEMKTHLGNSSLVFLKKRDEYFTV